MQSKTLIEICSGIIYCLSQIWPEPLASDELQSIGKGPREKN